MYNTCDCKEFRECNYQQLLFCIYSMSDIVKGTFHMLSSSLRENVVNLQVSSLVYADII